MTSQNERTPQKIWRSLKSRYNHLLFRLGWNICPYCGSKNIIRRETVGSDQIQCYDCGKVKGI